MPTIPNPRKPLSSTILESVEIQPSSSGGESSGYKPPSSFSPPANTTADSSKKAGTYYLKLPLSAEGRSFKSSSKTSGDKSLSKNRINQQQPLGRVLPSPKSLESVPRYASGSSSNGYVPANLGLLQGTEHLFMRKCKKFPVEVTSFRPKTKYEIINSSGRCIYYSGQTIDKFSWFRNEFTYHCCDYNGRTVLISSGRQFIPGITASAIIYQSDGNVLGTATQDCCDAGYIVKDKEGRPTFRIRGPCYGSCTPCVFWCFEEHFEIDLEDGVTETGLISTNWKETHPENSGIFGIHVPIVLENHQKALLLGAAFLIHFQYFRRGGNGTWICSLLFLLAVGLIYPVWYLNETF